MQIDVFTPDQFLDMPWKNGAGSTRELYRHPKADTFDLRISIALIEADGPFSLFPEHERIIMSLSGPAVRLDHPHKSVLLEHFSPYEFSGALSTYATLQAKGAAQDFNVMVRKGHAMVLCDVLTCNLRVAAANQSLFLYVLDKALRIESSTNVLGVVNAGALAKIDQIDDDVSIVTNDGRYIAVHVYPTDE